MILNQRKKEDVSILTHPLFSICLDVRNITNCNANGGKSQCHLVGVRGYGMRYCNANGGKSQRHFMGVRGYFTDCSPRIHGTNMVYWGGMQSQNL